MSATDPASTSTDFHSRIREACSAAMPQPGGGSTPLRHALLFQVGREDLSLAKIVEAHFDAVAILTEAEEEPEPGAVYAVWASELPGKELRLDEAGGTLAVSGTKPFCSGGTLVDRALITVAAPEPLLVEIDLRGSAAHMTFNTAGWQTEAFRQTETGAVTFASAPAGRVVGPAGFYLHRPGFWNGACGPAACWAGGAAGLLDYARESSRNDPHTAAHRAAMESAVWAMETMLAETGREIDREPGDSHLAHVRAVRLRHLVEQHATGVLRRFARAYGPHPLAMNAATSRKYAELDIFLRQFHGERDLEALGRALADTTL